MNPMNRPPRWTFETQNDFVNESATKMDRGTDAIIFSRSGLSRILGINDETYKKLYPSWNERKKISYSSFTTNLFEKKYSDLKVNFDDNQISYRKTKVPHFGMSLRMRGGFVIMRTLQGITKKAPKVKIIESKKKIEGDLLKAFE